jgi:hypothetical protein
VGSWAGAGFGASALFFFITNYFVWQTSGMYNRTWDGLVTCFQMALPFFHEHLMATWMFSAITFCVWDYVVEPNLATRVSN